jgi:hypothetical protein
MQQAIAVEVSMGRSPSFLPPSLSNRATPRRATLLASSELHATPPQFCYALHDPPTLAVRVLYRRCHAAGSRYNSLCVTSTVA